MRPTSVLYLTVHPELKDLVEKAAGKEGIPTNEYVSKILAEEIKRQDLAKIPRKRRAN